MVAARLWNSRCASQRQPKISEADKGVQMTQRSFAAAVLVTLSCAAVAHEGAMHANTQPLNKEQKAWGIAGDTKAAKRSITVTMGDNMRFTPERIEVRQGETVRFVVKNGGQMRHEFVIGTNKELEEHAALMKRFPNMEHDEPYMAHVAPGKSGDLVWTFNRPGEFDFACLVAGHYEAGMKGRIIVKASKS
jgi:uncharacterized cupredoxin-like copper-binding protein